jgi:long-subunit acyl-CoA synthetase (AMP-forming)
MSNPLIDRLVDDDGKDVAPGEPGEALIKGPVVSQGYHNNSEANKSGYAPGGWLKTGDILRLKDDELYVVDRKKVQWIYPLRPSPKNRPRIKPD